MSVLIKICGITRLDDALDAVECGADLLGFNFYPDSPRYIEPSMAKEILAEVPPTISSVGIFVNADRQKVIDVACDLELNFLQFHGDESPEYCNGIGHPWYKAFRLKDESSLVEMPRFESEWLMVDAYVEKAFGGTGVVSNWDLARSAKKFGKLFLSGGLNPENIDWALKAVSPYAVDVASGIEDSPGIKNHYKLEEFIMRVKRYNL